MPKTKQRGIFGEQRELMTLAMLSYHETKDPDPGPVGTTYDSAAGMRVSEGERNKTKAMTKRADFFSTLLKVLAWLLFFAGIFASWYLNRTQQWDVVFTAMDDVLAWFNAAFITIRDFFTGLFGS